MKLSIFAIKDTKTGFLSMTTEQNVQCAVRNFDHAMKNTQSLLYTHPEDFELYHLGEYDTESGIITPLPTPEFIVAGSSLVIGRE